MKRLELVPVPRRVESLSGTATISSTLAAALSTCSFAEQMPSEIRASIDSRTVKQKEGYVLSLEPDGIGLQAADRSGLLYGLMSLRQLSRQAGESGVLPCLRIEDWPEFPVRGVTLDISRDRIPTMSTLKRLVDLWAELKLNQVQLYTEHAFAYPSHAAVWQGASPITPEEAQELDRYCVDRAIELVPNQNSFGHMERWLRHPQYRHLAEAPEGFTDRWGLFREQPSTLNPLDPATAQFLAGLYDELLPNFSSRMLNVGGDEPWELGQGRSREVCEQRGVGRVYLDFLLKIYEQVVRRGRTMQLYGDIILHYPELIGELPKDVVALDWGYEANHPFAPECRAFAEAGLRFYVCPGTSSWNSIGGRWNNARANIQAAVREGLSAGAGGFLLTDWGDNGHWQQLPVSYPAYAYGAAAAWNPQGAREMDLEACLSRHLFRDRSGKAARGLMLVENVYNDEVARFHNAGVLAVLLLPGLQPYHQAELERYRGHGFSQASSQLEEALQVLRAAEIRAEDGGQLREELEFTAELMAHAARLGRERFATPGLTVGEIPQRKRKALADELEALIERFRKLWLARSRPGGLEDSAGRLTALKQGYLRG